MGLREALFSYSTNDIKIYICLVVTPTVGPYLVVMGACGPPHAIIEVKRCGKTPTHLHRQIRWKFYIYIKFQSWVFVLANTPKDSVLLCINLFSTTSIREKRILTCVHFVPHSLRRRAYAPSQQHVHPGLGKIAHGPATSARARRNRMCPLGATALLSVHGPRPCP